MLKPINTKIVYNERYILVDENLSFKKVLEFIAISINRPKPEKPLKKWMISIGWFVQKTASLFGYNRNITKSDIAGIFQKSTFDNTKIKKEINFKFTPMQNVIAETGKYFLKDQEKKETIKN